MQNEKLLLIKYRIYLTLLFIFVDIVCDNYIFRTFNTQSYLNAFLLFLGMSVAQIVASPIQAGLSDIYGRKQGLLFSLSASLLSIIFVYFYNGQVFSLFLILVLVMLLKGCMGNTTPLSWSAIADIQDKKFRFSFGLSTASFAFAYLILNRANRFFTKEESNIGLFGLVFISIICCALFFRNTFFNKQQRGGIGKQKSPKEPLSTWGFRRNLILKEIKVGINELKKNHIKAGLLAFVLWETSLYSILLLYVDFDIDQFSGITLAMMFGYITGIVILKFIEKISDAALLKAGYYFSTLSLVPFLILFPFLKGDNSIFLGTCYFFHALGNAFLCPTLFAILAKEKNIDEQGTIYGLVGSADTVAFLLASIVVRIYNTYEMNLIYIIMFSFVTIAISWYPYRKFEMIRPKSHES